MQLIQVHATSRPPGWLLAGGALALALGAGPASAAAAPTGISLASAAAAVRAAQAPPAALISPGAPSDAAPGGTALMPSPHPQVIRVEQTAAGDTGLQPGGEHAPQPPVLTPGAATPGGTDVQSTGDLAPPAPMLEPAVVDPGASSELPAPAAPVLRPEKKTPGDTGVQSTGDLPPQPPALTPEALTPGDTGSMSPKERDRPAALMTTQHTRPVGTGDQGTGDHTPPPPPVLAVGEATAGGTGGMSAKDRERPAPLMTPQHERAVGTGDESAGAHVPHPSSVEGWMLAAFPGEQGPLVVFSEANRLSLATLASFPSPSSALDLPGQILGLRVAAGEGLLLVLADLGSEGVAVVDVADPGQPLLIALVR